MKTQKLVKRTYRITKQHDDFIKSKARSFNGESAYLRRLISFAPELKDFIINNNQ